MYFLNMSRPMHELEIRLSLPPNATRVLVRVPPLPSLPPLFAVQGEDVAAGQHADDRPPDHLEEAGHDAAADDVAEEVLAGEVLLHVLPARGHPHDHGVVHAEGEEGLGHEAGDEEDEEDDPPEGVGGRGLRAEEEGEGRQLRHGGREGRVEKA